MGKQRPGYWAEWYSNPENRKRHKAAAHARTKAVRKAIREFLNLAKDRPCSDCGETYPPWVMQFDHLPGSGKIFMVASANKLGVSLEKVQREIAKCEVVCANCHAHRTYERGMRRGASDPCKV